MEGLSNDLFHKQGRPKDSNVSRSIPYNSRVNVTWWYYDRWLGVVGQCRGHDGGPAKRCIPQTRPTKGQQCKQINSSRQLCQGYLVKMWKATWRCGFMLWTLPMVGQHWKPGKFLLRTNNWQSVKSKTVFSVRNKRCPAPWKESTDLNHSQLGETEYNHLACGLWWPAVWDRRDDTYYSPHSVTTSQSKANHNHPKYRNTNNGRTSKKHPNQRWNACQKIYPTNTANRRTAM